MRVSPDGNTHFARQENGQFFANGNEKKLGGFGSGSGDIKLFIWNRTISKAGCSRKEIPFQRKK